MTKLINYPQGRLLPGLCLQNIASMLFYNYIKEFYLLNITKGVEFAWLIMNLERS